MDTSYDDTVSFSRPREDDSGMYELVQRLEFRGAVEGLAFAKVRWELFMMSPFNSFRKQVYKIVTTKRPNRE